MKLVFLILLTITVLPHLRAEESLPPDVQRVLGQRAAAVTKIDNICLEELEKLKVNYTKQGNLETANAIVSLIKELKLVRLTEESIIGKWKRINSNATWNFRPDGTGVYATPNKRYDIRWEKADDHVYKILFDTVPRWNRKFHVDESGKTAEEVPPDEARIKNDRITPS